MTSEMARERIHHAYRNGERDIHVSLEVFRAYSDSLVALERSGPLPADGVFEQPKWVAFKDAKVFLRDDVPPNTMYFLPNGSYAKNLITGQTEELMPGYYVNPRQCGVIKNVT